MIKEEGLDPFFTSDRTNLYRLRVCAPANIVVAS